MVSRRVIRSPGRASFQISARPFGQRTRCGRAATQWAERGDPRTESVAVALDALEPDFEPLHPGLARDIGKRPFAVVLVKDIGPEVPDFVTTPHSLAPSLIFGL